MKSRLIIVEGIPGSGKSTTANYIKDSFEKQGIPVQFYQEGDTEHPADYESTACLTDEQFQSILKKYPHDKELISNYTEQKGDLYFVHYYDLYHENKSKESLVDEFAPYDVYELNIDTYEKVAADYWQEFAEKALEKDTVYIFECCFIQNPFTKFIAKDNASISRFQGFMKKVTESVKPLKPKVVYFYQDHVKETFKRTYEERNQGWQQFFTEYHTKNGYGKAHGLEGFDGLIEFLTMRRGEELKLLSELDLEHILIENDKQNWDKYYEQINTFIGG